MIDGELFDKLVKAFNYCILMQCIRKLTTCTQEYMARSLRHSEKAFGGIQVKSN